MKVLQINAVIDYGSTGRIVAELSDYMDQCGIDNCIAYSAGSTVRENAYRIGSDADHKIHTVLSRTFGLQGYFSVLSTKKLVAWMDKYEPDLVHLHNLHANYINFRILFRYLAERKIPVIVTLHDCFFYTGKCVYYTLAHCNRWQDCCGHCPQLKTGNPSLFFDWTGKMLRDKKQWFSSLDTLGVIGVSQWITNEAQRSILAQASQIERLYNWINLSTFYPHPSEIRCELGLRKKFLVLGVSISWTIEKGAEDYNALAEMLDDRFDIVLVGRTWVPLHSRIINIDRTQNIQMLSDLYSTADVFYNPTRRETFGKVTAEALACGTPVVAYRTTACTELVPEDCGFLESLGDVSAVAKDIAYLAEHKEDYTWACRRFAEENFDKDKILKETIAFYQSILDKSEN